jgi:hypothetical protein
LLNPDPNPDPRSGSRPKVLMIDRRKFTVGKNKKSIFSSSFTSMKQAPRKASSPPEKIARS